MKDASQNPIVASKLLNSEEKNAFTHQLQEDYKQIQEQYENKQNKLLSLEEARQRKPNLFEN